MNYLQQILAFDDYRLYEQKLSAGQIALWHALMSINNKAHWQKWFTAANLTLESLTGLSRSGINQARNSLKQSGLIDFEVLGPHKATKYSIKQLYTSDSVHSGVHSSVHYRDKTVNNYDTFPRQNSDTLIKLNKTETKQEDDDGRARVLDLWQNLWGFPNAIARQDLDEWMTSLSPALVQYAIEVAGHHDVQARAADKYVGKVVQGWLDLKITTLKAAQQANTEHEQRLSNQQGYNRFQQPKQRETVPDWGQDDYDASQHHVDVSDAEQTAAQARLDQLRREHEQQGEQQEGAM